jgi:hypothetical protein
MTTARDVCTLIGMTKKTDDQPAKITATEKERLKEVRDSHAAAGQNVQAKAVDNLINRSNDA